MTRLFLFSSAAAAQYVRQRRLLLQLRLPSDERTCAKGVDALPFLHPPGLRCVWVFALARAALGSSLWLARGLATQHAMLPLLTTTCTAFHAPATAVHAGSCVPPARHAAAICSSTGSAGPLIRSAFLSLIAGQSAFALATEVPSLFSSSPDIFGTLFDAGFLFYSGRLLAGQAGLVGGDEALAEKLAGLDCTCTLSIGREPGTWMPKEWGSSGARLSLPLQLRFSEEVPRTLPRYRPPNSRPQPVHRPSDGGPRLPGRGEHDGAHRAAALLPRRRLLCRAGRHRPGGAYGRRVERQADPAAWRRRAAPPRSISASLWPPCGLCPPGELRFFLDFPTEAARNDVTLPAGRALAAPAPSTGLRPEPWGPSLQAGLLQRDVRRPRAGAGAWPDARRCVRGAGQRRAPLWRRRRHHKAD